MVRLALILLMTMVGTAHADPWAFFHAEKVTSLSCDATTMRVNFGAQTVEKYEATAHAKREGMDDWSATLGYWDVNDNGRDSAIETCKKWIKAAAKKARIAHGGTK